MGKEEENGRIFVKIIFAVYETNYEMEITSLYHRKFIVSIIYHFDQLSFSTMGLAKRGVRKWI